MPSANLVKILLRDYVAFHWEGEFLETRQVCLLEVNLQPVVEEVQRCKFVTEKEGKGHLLFLILFRIKTIVSHMCFSLLWSVSWWERLIERSLGKGLLRAFLMHWKNI